MTATHSITASQVKDIKTAFATLKPQKVTLDGNRAMTVKEAIFALAPTLERMKKRGFDLPELVEKLHEKGIPVKAPTLAKYLNEFRRGKRKKAEGKTDTSLLSMPVRLEDSPTGTASPPSVGSPPPKE